MTIPQHVRERLGLLPHTEVEFQVRGQVAILRKADRRRRGSRLVERMRGRGTVPMSTEQIMALTRDEGGGRR